MAGDVTIDWGDGSPKEDAGEKDEVSHKYAEDAKGEVTIKVCSKADPDKCTEEKVTIPMGEGDGGGEDKPEEPKPEPKAEAKPDEGDKAGRTVKLIYSGFPDDGVSIDWGDESEPDKGEKGKGEATHAYGDGVKGEQTITVTGTKDEKAKAEAKFEPKAGEDKPEDPEKPEDPKEPKPEPKVEAKAGSWDESGRTGQVIYSSFPEGDVVIDWGDGSEPARAEGPKGKASHKYGEKAEGEQTITVTSVEDEKATGEAKFEPKADGGGGDKPEEPKDPEKPGEVSVKVKPDEADEKGLSVLATVDNGGKPALIDFGEGEPVENKGDGKDESKYSYSKAGTYTVTASDKEDDTQTGTAEVEVPSGGGEDKPEDPEKPEEPKPEPKAEAKADEADKAGRTVALTYSGFPEGKKVGIDWGDGGAPEVMDKPEGTAKHEYPEDVEGEQKITVASEDEKTKAEAKFTPKAPGEDKPKDPAGEEEKPKEPKPDDSKPDKGEEKPAPKDPEDGEKKKEEEPKEPQPEAPKSGDEKGDAGGEKKPAPGTLRSRTAR